MRRVSGVAALFYRRGRPADDTSCALVGDMLAAAPYRGPDGRAIRKAGPAVIGHLTFVITREEQAELQTTPQPLVSPRSGCVLTADARIDNRDALIEQLGDPDVPAAQRAMWPETVGGATAAGVSDAWLILRAYDAWGEAAFERLLGDFAVIIWDPRRGRLICARDTSGQRALFYRDTPEQITAASEIQQLLRDPSVSIAPDRDRIRDYLVPLNVFRNEQDQATTFYEGIRALPAGHVLIATSEGLNVHPFWHLNLSREIRYRREEDYWEHFRALLFDAVRCRLRSAYPTGTLLSGGLDSSSIVAAAQQLYRSGRAHDAGFVSFTSVFDGLECDERSLVEATRSEYTFRARYVPVGTLAGRLQLTPQGFMEAPNLGIPEARDTLFGAITEERVRSVITGDVADSYVGGSWQVFDSLLRRGDVRQFVRYWRAYHRLPDASSAKSLVFGCVLPFLPLRLQQYGMSAYIRRTFARSRRALLPAWMPAATRTILARRHLDLMLEAEQGRRYARPAQEAEYRALYPPEMARYPAPWSVEIRRPFADRRLHEFVLAVPPETKFAPHDEVEDFYAGSKRLLRGAMQGLLPDAVRLRTQKTVFSAVHRSEVEQQWPVYEDAFGPGARSEVAAWGLVDAEAFWERLLAMRRGEHGRDSILIMQVIALETWLRTFRLPRAQQTAVARPWSGTSAGAIQSSSLDRGPAEATALTRSSTPRGSTSGNRERLAYAHGGAP
jgi:asparagine synthase (glutamine-hydrolysing)